MDPIKIIRFLNFINNFDPFHFDKEEPQISSDSLNRKRARWAKWMDLFFILLPLKGLSMFAFVCCLHFGKLEWATEFITPAFAEMNILAPLFLFSGPAFALFAFGILPRLIKSSMIVVDPDPIKFLLEPEREIARLDFKINSIIDDMIDSARRKEANHLYQIDKLCPGKSGSDPNSRRGSVWMGLECYKSQLVELKAHYTTLRPQTCSYGYISSYRTKAKLWSNFLIISVANVTTIFFSLSVVKIVEDKCKALNMRDKCDFFKEFQWREQVKAFEFFIFTFLCYINYMYTLIMMVLTLDTVLEQAKDFRSDLMDCLNQLRYFNSRLFPVGEEQVFKLVQRTMIKTILFDDNIKKGAKLLGRLIGFFIISGLSISSGMLVGFLLTKRSKESYFSDLIVVILGPSYAWMIFNLPAVLNAYTNARIMDNLKLYWPIRAELLHYVHRNKANRFDTSHLISQWAELEHYWFEVNTDEYVAQPLGLNFTYHSVIEANFYVVSLVSSLVK